MHLSSGPDLPEYLREELRAVEQLTGKPLYVGTGCSTFDSEVHAAGPRDAVHTLQVNPAYAEHAAHFLANAVRKIRRLYEAPEHERYLAAVDVRRRLPADIERDLRGRLRDVPEGPLLGMSRFLFYGLARQVTSMPLDLRVERELYEDLPVHRDTQVAYLERQLRDLVPQFAPEIEAMAPSALYRASSSMNVALALGFGEIAEVDMDPVFEASPHHGLGRELNADLAAVTDHGLAGDRKAVDAWAHRLGLEGWFEWIRHDRR